MKPAAYKWNLAALKAIPPNSENIGPYATFDQINGNHPWKYAVPNGFVEYQARILKKTKVVYFNFNLAKEMGLIEKNHPTKLTKELEKKILETFSIRIVNEYDQLTGAKFSSKEMKANRYMATRYLQLQHASKNGGTSGDGRSVWNGHFTSATGTDWDISSCGTGVTCLSPGSVCEGKPVRTGDKRISYGSGLADIDEGLTAAILSESFHQRGFLTERTLVVLEGPEGNGINVRAAKNLIRPSHLFLHLKQNNQLMLKSALDFYIAKQIYNGDWPAGTKEQGKYESFLKKIAKNYAKFAAHLEDEYIFCWLDWDGDNMLLDGGIIDYGSIRQFGICHHHYRYDDVTRFSTNLKEQKNKAKNLVQTFHQLVDFVETGVRRKTEDFRNSKYTEIFEKQFKHKKMDFLLRRLGLNAQQRKRILKFRPKLANEFDAFFRKIEKKESNRGVRKTPDGKNCPAIFNAKALLRELPRRLLLNEKLLHGDEFVKIIETPFATKKELKKFSNEKIVAQFQNCYIKIVRAAHPEKSLRRALLETAMRASQFNRADIATGDGIIYVVNLFLSKRKRLGKQEFFKLTENFIQLQKGLPSTYKLQAETKKVFFSALKILEETKYSI